MHRCQPEVYVLLAFSMFSCSTNELENSHFSIYNLTLSTKKGVIRAKEEKFNFRLMSVAQKRLCLNSLLFAGKPDKNDESVAFDGLISHPGGVPIPSFFMQAKQELITGLLHY